MPQSDVSRRALLAEYLRRQKLKEAALESYEPTASELSTARTLKNLWFGPQKAFFESPHTRKVAFCTRRAGKTIGVAIDACATLLENPTSLLLYVAQTRDTCKLYLWQELKRYVRTYDLPFETNEQMLTLRHKRGNGMLILKGADKEDEIEKWRGPKWLRAYLDESGTFGAHLESAVVSVIGPALRDQNGTLMLLGTAGRKKEGLFYEASTGQRKIYEVHKWSLQDNPYLSANAKNLEYIKEEEGLTDEDPRFIREYLGRWATGDSERVFSGFSTERNVYDALLPEGHEWRYLLGCDFGFTDECAITLVAYSPTHPTIYFPETWSKKHAFPSDVAAVIFDMRAKYGVRRYIGDAGGLGKMYVVQLARDYGIMFEPAKKMEKLNYVEFLNSEFYKGKVLVHASQQKLINQFTDCAWNADRTDVGKHERDDLAFSAVYGWRAARNSGAGKTVYKEIEDGMTSLQREALREKLAALRYNPNDTANPDAQDAWYERLRGASLRGNSDETNPARPQNAYRSSDPWWGHLPAHR